MANKNSKLKRFERETLKKIAANYHGYQPTSYEHNYIVSLVKRGLIIGDSNHGYIATIEGRRIINGAEEISA